MDGRSPPSKATSPSDAQTPAFLKTDPHTLIKNGILTFTRASISTVVNFAGLIETVPSDAMRLDHDNATLA